ncbi:MBL fold metallo-hydrolase (plasmid) [Leisingera aquaemixtae]|uniref:MBL fold metallo-hydrolase n=1 Tax=Leisingera aquaemixtae TaxID=1396826 RepID=A0ABY5WRQ3_9RHOB|nr:MBL fold metallo-hydrolase [Leisingera aquaemixtae]UWQ44035.1 MBL fold metallo-hydrolase [Leisingera aquaemixtae]
MKQLISKVAPIMALALLPLMSAPALAQEEGAMRVTLLGTGGPEFFPDRLGISTLVEANGQMLLFDVGRGTEQRLYESRINPKDITTIFLTHLHNDHYEGLPALWMTPWFLLGRDHGFELWGPEGSQEMVEGLRMMFAHDLEKRVNQFNPEENLHIEVHPLSDGVVFDRDGVTVTAFPVEHKDGNPSYGFRIDHEGRSVVLSGDTTLNENVTTHGEGADVIVHNVIAFSERLSAMPEMKGVLAKLTTPEQAAEVFSRTEPELAVYSHIVTKDLGVEEGPNTIMERTRAAGYDGPLVMGEDRMTILIGETVEVLEPAPIEGLPILDSKDQVFPPEALSR